MKHRDAVRVIANAAHAEFSEPIFHTPMVRPPNERPQSDPYRHKYETCGIFDKNHLTSHRGHKASLRVG